MAGEQPSAPPPAYDPQTSFPPQGVPQQGYPPPQGVPPQQYPPPQGVPPQQYPPPQGVPPQQYLPPQGVPPQQYPPAQGVPQQGYPPPQGVPPQQYPPPQGVPPQQYEPHQLQGIPQQGTSVTPQGISPQHPLTEGVYFGEYPLQTGDQQPPVIQTQAPPSGVYTGLTVMDTFHDKNEVQLVAKCNGLPVRNHNGHFFGNGDFEFMKESNFIVHVTGTDTIMLQSAQNTGRWLTILNNKEVSARGRGDANCTLKVHLLPDNFVMLESVEMPGHFVNITGNGRSKPPASVTPTDPDGQFYVRITKQSYAPSQPIMCGGQLSVLNQLKDRMLVQLVTRTGGKCLMISRNGIFTAVNDTTDNQTFWTLCDRGMGIISLRSQAHNRFWLRYFKGSLASKGGEKELSGDFRVIENPDRSISLELVKELGSFVTLNGEKSFTLFEVVLTGPAVSRKPLN